MNFTELLETQVGDSYKATDDLLSLVEDNELNWKPAQGANWWTVGQLLKHMTVSCGIWCKGFVTSEWDEAGDVDFTKMPEGVELPPAEAYISIETVQAAREALAADKQVALDAIEKATEEALSTQEVTAPWNPNARLLALRIFDMIRHLESHKAQLYYYLKLMGKPVHTGHLWGMGNVVED